MRFFTRPPVWGVRGIRKSIESGAARANPAAWLRNESNMSSASAGEARLRSPALRRVLRVVAACLCLAAAGDGAGTAGDVGLHTLPGIEPPQLSVVEPPLGTVRGLVFLAQKAGGKNQPGGPLIVDPRGRVVWFHQLPSGVTATDFRAQ